MISTEIQIKGTERVRARLREMRRVIPSAVMVGVYELAERVMDDAVDRVPVDTGDLRDSAYVARPDVDTNTTVMELGFGAEHAVYVHEDTSAAHDTGESKFLEKAMFSIARGSLHKIVKRAEKAAQTGARWTQGKYPTRPKS